MDKAGTIPHTAFGPIKTAHGGNWTFPANFYFGNDDKTLCLSVLNEAVSNRRFPIWGNRSGTSVSFNLSTFEKVPIQSPKTDEGAVTFTSKRLDIWASAVAQVGQTADLWHASWSLTKNQFIYDANPLSISNSAVSDNDVIISVTGLHLYYATRQLISGLSRQRVVITTRPRITASFTAPPQELSTLKAGGSETDYSDSDPSLNADERIIVFASTRQPAQTSKHRLFYAVRNTVNDPFGTPVAIPGLDKYDDIFEPGLSSDGR